MKLANFQKTFGMEELGKGYFPHLFNKKENETYIGPIPPTPYYNPNGMSPSDREKFMEWHNGMRDSNYVFNFQEEIVAYCRSDVDGHFAPMLSGISRVASRRNRDRSVCKSHDCFGMQHRVPNQLSGKRHHRHYPTARLPPKE